MCSAILWPGHDKSTMWLPICFITLLYFHLLCRTFGSPREGISIGPIKFSQRAELLNARMAMVGYAILAYVGYNQVGPCSVLGSALFELLALSVDDVDACMPPAEQTDYCLLLLGPCESNLTLAAQRAIQPARHVRLKRMLCCCSCCACAIFMLISVRQCMLVHHDNQKLVVQRWGWFVGVFIFSHSLHMDCCWVMCVLCFHSLPRPSDCGFRCLNPNGIRLGARLIDVDYTSCFKCTGKCNINYTVRYLSSPSRSLICYLYHCQDMTAMSTVNCFVVQKAKLNTIEYISFQHLMISESWTLLSISVFNIWWYQKGVQSFSLHVCMP